MFAPRQLALVELSYWLGRVMQYSASHPASTEIAGKVWTAITRLVETESPVDFGIMKDGVMLGEVPASHPAVTTKLAPHLHDRGVLVLRFVHGVTQAELDAFMAIIVQPVQSIFDRGGLKQLLGEAGVAGVQIEELAHDISEEQRESGRRRRRLRDFFADVLQKLRARRDIGVAFGERLGEMLAYAEITAAILEDQGAGLAEAAAGLALMVQEEERRTGVVLAPKLRAIFSALTPMARDRLLLGFPPLVGEFRAALAWAMRGYREDDLSPFVFPSFRARANDLDDVLYALSVLVPHDGTRLSTLRRVGLLLHDLPFDDPVASEVLAAIAQPVAGFESYKRERGCLVEPAARALGARQLATLTFEPSSGAEEPPTRAEVLGTMRELVHLLAYTRQFGLFCQRLPDAAAAMATSGATASLLELVRALVELKRPEGREPAQAAAQAIIVAQASELLVELDRSVDDLANDELGPIAQVVRTICAHAPRPALDHVEHTTSERMRKLLIAELPAAGARLLPLVRGRLVAEADPAIVDLLGLLVRIGARPDDLSEIARHRDERVRLEVVRVLRALPADERTMDLVVRYLADPVPAVRAAVRMMVRGELLGPTAITAIGRLLADGGQPEEVKNRLVEALGHSHVDAAAHLLFHQLEPHALLEIGGASALRDLAAVALRRCPAPSAARLFAEGLESPQRRVRKACERAANKAGA
jgi:hypothetical protein